MTKLSVSLGFLKGLAKTGPSDIFLTADFPNDL